MKYWKAGIMFFFAFVLQSSLLNMVSIGGYTPNLGLALVIVFSFLFDEAPYGILFGSIYGLIYDICYEEIVGTTAITFLLVALLIYELRYGMNIENPINMTIAGISSIVLYYVSYWGLLIITGENISVLRMTGKLIFSGAYTFGIAFICYLILLRLKIKHKNDRRLR